MTYNVENLFDTEDDPGKEDETYLPATLKNSKTHKDKCKKIKNFKFRSDCYRLDWNLNTLNSKMRNLSEVILSVDAGKGPDILILVEVENERVLKKLNQEYLQAAAYETVEIVEGRDPRGIDIAILSRFSKTGPAELFPLEIEGHPKTRGVLRVSLQISKAINLSVFGIHLPSQGNSTSTRRQGLQSLVKIVQKEKNPWLVGGDFNITHKENQESQLLEKELLSWGQISHIIGCELCKGTHNYKGKWSFLDMFFFDHRFGKHGITIIKNSIKTVSLDSFTFKKAKPKRFDPAKGQGASDHFPLYVRLKVEK